MTNCKNCLHECYTDDLAENEACNFFVDKAEYVKVVHCKDCKHLGFKGLCYGYCKNRVCGIVNPSDFCSYGERKDGWE